MEKDNVCDIAKSFRLSNNIVAQIMSSQDCSGFHLLSGIRGEQYPPSDNLAPCFIPSSTNKHITGTYDRRRCLCG